MTHTSVHSLQSLGHICFTRYVITSTLRTFCRWLAISVNVCIWLRSKKFSSSLMSQTRCEYTTQKQFRKGGDRLTKVISVSGLKFPFITKHLDYSLPNALNGIYERNTWIHSVYWRMNAYWKLAFLWWRSLCILRRQWIAVDLYLNRGDHYSEYKLNCCLHPNSLFSYSSLSAHKSFLFSLTQFWLNSREAQQHNCATHSHIHWPQLHKCQSQ